MTTITVQVPQSPQVPRGARWASSAFASFLLLLERVWRSAAARPLSRTEEAQAVRQLALSVQATQPSFAADLLAAAARHEGIEE
jgi:hypothetical protein